MPQQDENAGEIRLHDLKGLNERAAPNALPGGEFALLEGLYPKQTGSLTRLPGKRLWQKLSTGAIWKLHQTHDGSGNVIIQTSNTLEIFTLDALLGRSSAPSLTYPSITEEESMSMALIVHWENTGTDAGALGAANDTEYALKLTDMIVNQSSTVNTFSASPTNTFVLVPGIYRIRAWHTFYNPTADNASFEFYLYNVTNSRIENQYGGSNKIISSSLRVQNGSDTNLMSHLTGMFEVSTVDNTFELRGLVHNITDATVLASNAAILGKAGNVTGGQKEQYCAIEILKTA